MASILEFKPRPPSIEEALGLDCIAGIVEIEPAFLKRRMASGRSVGRLQEQRLVKLYRIWDELQDLFTIDGAVEWMHKPHPALSGRSPKEVMQDDGGLDRVLDEIGRMKWGIPG